MKRYVQSSSYTTTNWNQVYRDAYDTVIRYGRHSSHIDKISQLAQIIYAKDRTADKADCAWQAIEWYEGMTGYYFDPTRDQLNDITYGLM